MAVYLNSVVKVNSQITFLIQERFLSHGRYKCIRLNGSLEELARTTKAGFFTRRGCGLISFKSTALRECSFTKNKKEKNEKFFTS